MGIPERERGGSWSLAVESPIHYGCIWRVPGGDGDEPEGGVHELQGVKYRVVLFDGRPWFGGADHVV